MKQNNGSCGCGAVKYTLDSEIWNVVNCHCNMCKEHNGASFTTYAALALTGLKIKEGNEFITKYREGTGNKHFCKRCGTPLYNTNEKYPGACMIFFGTLNNSTQYTPKVNVWCESQYPWLNKLSEINSLQQGLRPGKAHVGIERTVNSA